MTESECDAFWTRAKARLKENNLTLKEYSAVTGIPLQTLYGQIKKHRLPSAEDFVILSTITRSDPEWLMWGGSPSGRIKELLAVYSGQDGSERDDIAKLESQMQELIEKLKGMK